MERENIQKQFNLVLQVRGGEGRKKGKEENERRVGERKKEKEGNKERKHSLMFLTFKNVDVFYPLLSRVKNSELIGVASLLLPN